MKILLNRLLPLPRRFSRALRAEHLEIRPGVSYQGIEDFEHRFSVILPSDMKRFYTEIDGMAESEWGFESDMRILPLAEVKPVREEFAGASSPAENQPAGAFVICDNSLSAYFFAIDLQASGNPVFMVHSEPIRVATGFSDFIEKVLANSNELFRGEHAV